jgi:hypothetical protein
MSQTIKMNEYVDTVIVGGGQAGAAPIFFLQQNQIDHIILEKESAFSKSNKRWKPFHMNTANWMNSLPGEPDNFAKEAPWSAIYCNPGSLPTEIFFPLKHFQPFSTHAFQQNHSQYQKLCLSWQLTYFHLAR